MPRALTLLHRWTGIVVGLWIALVALSGIGMVFSTSFYGWELGDAQTHVEMRNVPYAAPDVWLAKAEAKYGKLPSVEGFFGPRATPMRISAPTIVYTPTGTHKHGIVTVDPYSGEPLAHFIADDTLAFIPLWLHLSLFMGEEISPWILVALSTLLFLFGVTGLYLWWPGRARWKAASAIPVPSSPTRLRRFHAAVGFWSSPLLVLAAITGLLLAQHDVAEAVTAPLGTSAEFDLESHKAATCAPRAPVTAGEALASARRIYPGTELAMLFLPTPDHPYYAAWLRPAGTTVPARGDREVFIGARCGEIAFARGHAEMKAGDTVMTYLVELHNGRLLGLFGEGLILLQGIALTTLPIAGISLWLWKRRRRGKTVLIPTLNPRNSASAPLAAVRNLVHENGGGGQRSRYKRGRVKKRGDI